MLLFYDKESAWTRLRQVYAGGVLSLDEFPPQLAIENATKQTQRRLIICLISFCTLVPCIVSIFHSPFHVDSFYPSTAVIQHCINLWRVNVQLEIISCELYLTWYGQSQLGIFYVSLVVHADIALASIRITAFMNLKCATCVFCPFSFAWQSVVRSVITILELNF